MGDDDIGLVDGAKSRIVTKFLLDTCRLLHTSEHCIEAAWFCGGMARHHRDDDEVFLTPLTTGSAVSYTHLTLPTNREV